MGRLGSETREWNTGEGTPSCRSYEPAATLHKPIVLLIMSQLLDAFEDGIRAH